MLLLPVKHLAGGCRGKKVNTATIVTYTIGFTAAALVAVLGYVYANRALRKIQARANRPLEDQGFAGGLSEYAPAAAAAGTFGQLQGLSEVSAESSPDSRQAMLSQATNYPADSPTNSTNHSPSQRRLLDPTPHVDSPSIQSLGSSV